MSFESTTDDKIFNLLNCPKRVQNPQAKIKFKNGHSQVNYSVVSTDGSNLKFEVYKRQNLREGMDDDFSCGIAWLSPSGEMLTLKRYNGASHYHPNQLEKVNLGYNCHIHIATEKYIKANKKAEGFAEITEKYKTLEGALHCLVNDCNISNIQTNPDNINQMELFNDEY